MTSKQNKGIFKKNQEVLFFGNIIYVKFVITPDGFGQGFI